ncbi:MAG: carboxypeptidase-like regulatory domain-containing protein [Tannerellaceae bacterium]|jgi:hypothetical protein|nr:carboxypeptidase-like regulatory domain-containing protein [Tannerellaceae bacterium]
MMKTQRAQLLFLLLILYFPAILSQNNFELRGIVTDDNNNPLPNVNVFLIQSKRGTVTNSEGRFVITSNMQDMLSVSCVGYETFSTKVNASTGSLAIALKTSVNNLGEVVVTALSADDILRVAVSKIADNYRQSPFISNIMYRGEVSGKDTLLYMEETAFNVVKSYRRGFTDKYFMIKNRNFQFAGKSITLRRIGRFDFVNEASQIFDNSFYRKYKISRLPGTSFDNRSLYVLYAESNSANDTSNMTVYIDTEDMAFVRIESYANSGDQIIAQYKKMDGKYYLVNGQSVHINRNIRGVFPAKSTMITTGISHDLPPDNKDIEGIPVSREDILKDYATNELDTLFWNEHNALLPDFAVQSAMQKYRNKQADIALEKPDFIKDKALMRRLYRPNISLMISSDMDKDLYSLNYNGIAFNRFINYSFGRPILSSSIISLAYYMLAIPFEEVLSEHQLLNISGLNHKVNPTPFNVHLDAYVYGINESVLNDFKANNQYNFMRLHTIRNDSRYVKGLMIEEDLAKIDLSNKNNLMDYIRYYAMELAISRLGNIYNPFAKGAGAYSSDNRRLITDYSRSWVKYLFEPDADYRNHILGTDLSAGEELFVKRSAWFSLLNIISPQMTGLKKFAINGNNSFTFSVNYLRIPFGEMFGQNVWLTTNGRRLHGIFIKQYRNHETTSIGLGYKLYDMPLSKNILLTSTVDYWRQPSHLSFYDAQLRHGFHAGQMLELQLLYNRYIQANSLSILAGYDYKTAGYTPESYFSGRRFDLKLALKWRF